MKSHQSEVISSDWQPCLISNNLNPIFKLKDEISLCFTRQSTVRFLRYFGSVTVHPTILKAEKAGDEVSNFPQIAVKLHQVSNLFEISVTSRDKSRPSRTKIAASLHTIFEYANCTRQKLHQKVRPTLRKKSTV